jgi:hypothetical protein
MALYVYKFGGTDELEVHLQGGIITGELVGKGLLFIHGLTLHFSGASSATVTFAATGGSTQSPLTLAEVIAQIKSQTANAIAVRTVGKKLAFLDAGTPTVAVGLASDSTALAAFGFKGGTAVTGKYYNAPDGAAPRPISVGMSNDLFILMTEET